MSSPDAFNTIHISLTLRLDPVTMSLDEILTPHINSTAYRGTAKTQWCRTNAGYHCKGKLLLIHPSAKVVQQTKRTKTSFAETIASVHERTQAIKRAHVPFHAWNVAFPAL